jgi:predicted RNase H-like HicB family nuclease
MPRLCYLSLHAAQHRDRPRRRRRWIAEVRDLPGVLACGYSQNEALVAAQALALRAVADKLEHGETSIPLGLAFVVAAA